MHKIQIKHKKTVAGVAVAALALTGLGAGLAQAAIPDSGGVIHGCYHPQTDGHNSALGVIDTALSNGHCPSGQTEVSWPSATTAGPDGLSTLIVAATGQPISSQYPEGPGYAIAVCPADHPYVLGGGAYGPGGTPITVSAPVSALSHPGTYPIGPDPDQGEIEGPPQVGTLNSSQVEATSPYTLTIGRTDYEAAHAWWGDINPNPNSYQVTTWAICSA